MIEPRGWRTSARSSDYDYPPFFLKYIEEARLERSREQNIRQKKKARSLGIWPHLSPGFCIRKNLEGRWNVGFWPVSTRRGRLSLATGVLPSDLRQTRAHAIVLSASSESSEGRKLERAVPFVFIPPNLIEYEKKSTTSF